MSGRSARKCGRFGSSSVQATSPHDGVLGGVSEKFRPGRGTGGRPVPSWWCDLRGVRDGPPAQPPALRHRPHRRPRSRSGRRTGGAGPGSGPVATEMSRGEDAVLDQQVPAHHPRLRTPTRAPRRHGPVVHGRRHVPTSGPLRAPRFALLGVQAAGYSLVDALNELNGGHLLQVQARR
jgi:hypothetical protein